MHCDDNGDEDLVRSGRLSFAKSKSKVNTCGSANVRDDNEWYDEWVPGRKRYQQRLGERMKMLEATNGCGDLGCAKVEVETRGAPEPEWDGACQESTGLVDPSPRFDCRLVSGTAKQSDGDDETWSSRRSDNL